MGTFTRAIATAGGACALLACAPHRVVRARAAAPPTEHWESQVERLERDTPRRADFDLEVNAYATAVRQLEVVPEASAGEGMRRTIGALATALRDLPYAPSSMVLPTVLSMRARQVDMALAAPSDAAEDKKALYAIDAAAELLTQTANGPYENDPDVVEAAQALSQTVQSLRDPSRLRVSRSAIVGALAQALNVVQEMRQALLEGTAPAPP